MKRRCYRGLAIVHAALAAVLLCGAGASAQPEAVKTPTAVAPASGVAAVDTLQKNSPDSLRKALAAAQAELDRVAASPNQALDAPADTPASQLVLRQTLLRYIVRSYRQMLDDTAALDTARAEHATVEASLADWKIDTAQASFSMLRVEALRREVQTHLREIDAITARIAAIDSQTEADRANVRNAELQARQLLERIEKRDGSSATLVWERDLQLLRVRAASVMLDSLAKQQELGKEQLSVAQAELAFLQGQLAKTEGKVEFSAADRDTLFQQLDARGKTLDGQHAAQIAAEENARKNLSEARSRLEAAQQAQDAVAQERLQRALDIAQLRLDTARVRANALRLMITSIETQRAVWGIWYDSVQARDANVARQLGANLDGYRSIVRELDASIRAALRYTLVQLNEAETAVISAQSSEDAAFLRTKSALLRERAEWQARLLADIISAADLIDRWRSGFVKEAGRTSDSLGFEDVRYRATALLNALWSLELFTAQDVIEVEGRKITAERSITLGKVVSAVLILVVGLWVGRALITFACKLAVRYTGADRNAVRLAGKWVFALLAVIFFLLTLTTVKIPFTIFAFLGGAVAIGIGFGMQTLLKNLISGLMLLVERPFRLGDIVEVGPIRGTVSDINVRSSLIRDASGIETLVPNSTFLEQNVTNWTYTSSRVRYSSLKVGVAYGSPAQSVRALLLSIAGGHPLVLRDPGPDVLLEDFGTNGLVFSIQYWLDIRGNADSSKVASELRLTIEAEFAKAGIVLAFPQHDVHLDALNPIPVRVVEREEPASRRATPGAGASAKL